MTENKEILTFKFDKPSQSYLNTIKDLENLLYFQWALVHENCRGRVAPCLVCFRLPWLSDRTRA